MSVVVVIAFPLAAKQRPSWEPASGPAAFRPQQLRDFEVAYSALHTWQKQGAII
jgi:hypothetical protein